MNRMVLIGLLLRCLVGVWFIGDLTNPDQGYFAFGYETGRIARSIAVGEGFGSPLFHNTGPTAWMTPLYPLLLAAIFKLFGVYTKASAFGIIFIDSLFSALTCIPVFFIAQKIFNDRTAKFAGWTWAFFPYAIYLSANFVWDTAIATFFLTSLFCLSLYLDQLNSYKWWILFGLGWGIAILFNAAVLSVFPFLLAWPCYRLYEQHQKWFSRSATVIVLSFVCLVPWAARNYEVFHKFIPLRDNFWLEVYVGNNGITSHWFADALHPSTSKKELSEYESLGELGYMNLKRVEAVAYITQHPVEFVVMTIRRFVFTWIGFWSFRLSYLTDEPLDPANIVFSATITVLMLIGLRDLLRSQAQEKYLVLITLIAFPAIYYFTHPDMRYRHPIDPLIALLAAHAVAISTARARHASPLQSRG